MNDNKAWLSLGGFALVWCAFIGIATLGVHSTVRRHEDAQKRFQPGPGTVLSSEVGSRVSHNMDRDRDVTYYFAKITYRYFVGLVDHTSSRIAYDESASSDPTDARNLVAAFPVGKEVTVWHDPDRPWESLLEIAVPAKTWASLYFLCPFCLAGIGLILGTAKLALLARRMRNYPAAQADTPCAIPGWGTLRRTPLGYRILHRPSFLIPLVLIFFLGTFLSCLPLFALGGMHRPEALRIALWVSGVIALAGAVTWRMTQGSRVLFDLSGRKISIRRRFKKQEVDLDQVALVTLSWGAARSRKVVLVLQTREGRMVRLHVFGAGPGMAVVARQAAGQVARLLGKPLESGP